MPLRYLGRQVGEPSVTKPAPYQEIASYLRDKILSGEFAPGGELPSENMLVDQFGHTRKTISRAIEQLRSEGLIVTTQGARSKVRAHTRIALLATGENFRQRQATGNANSIAEAEAQGHRSKNLLLGVEEVSALPEIAKRLEVESGTKVVVRHQLNVVVGKGEPNEPMMAMSCYYRHEFAAGTALAMPEPIDGGGASLIESPAGPFRRTIAKFIEDVEWRMPRPDESKLLVIPPGVPVARILRTMYDVSGEPLEVLDSTLPGDRFSVRYEIPVPGKP